MSDIEVTREDREAAALSVLGFAPDDGHWCRGWCLSGTRGHATNSVWLQLERQAQAIAKARMEEREAMVKYARKIAGDRAAYVMLGPGQFVARLVNGILRGEHRSGEEH